MCNFAPFLRHSEAGHFSIKMALNKTGTKPKTRSQTHHAVFGNCDILPVTQLPTELHVINFYRLLKSQMPDSSQSALFDIIIKELGNIWERSFIPTIDDKPIKVKLTRYFDWKNDDSAFASVRKQQSRWENKPDEIIKRRNGFNKLFNIASCKCYDKLSITDPIVQSTCKCKNPLKKFRNKDDVIFYLDQMGKRERFISPQIDQTSTKQLKVDIQKETKKEERKQAEANTLKRQRAENAAAAVASTSTAII